MICSWAPPLHLKPQPLLLNHTMFCALGSLRCIFIPSCRCQTIVCAVLLAASAASLSATCPSLLTIGIRTIDTRVHISIVRVAHHSSESRTGHRYFASVARLSICAGTAGRCVQVAGNHMPVTRMSRSSMVRCKTGRSRSAEDSK